MLSMLFGGSETFRRNLTRIGGATVVAQVLAFAALPFLSRLYSPEDFGVLTMFTTIVGGVAAVITLRLEWLAPNQSSMRRSDQILGVGVWAVLVGVSLCAAVPLIGMERINTALNLPRESRAYWLVPVATFGIGLQMLLEARYIRAGDLTRVAQSKVAQACITLTLCLGLAITPLKPIGLMISYSAGFWAAVLVMSPNLKRISAAAARLRPVNVLTLWARHRQQILASLGLGIANIALHSAPVLLLSGFYDPRVVGWYGFVYRIAAAPLGLITNAVARSFWSEAATLARTDPAALRTFYQSSIKRLGALAIPLVCGCLSAPFWVPVLFGLEWLGAGELLAAASPYLVGILVFGPTAHFVVYGKQHIQLATDLATLAVGVIVFVVAVQLKAPAALSLALLSLVILLGYLARHALQLHASKVAARNMAS